MTGIQPPRSEDPSRSLIDEVTDEATDLARETAGGGLRLLYGLVAIAGGFALFFAVGETFDVWNPAVGLIGLALFSWLGFAIWKLHRYTVATLTAFFGAALAAVADGAEGMGLTIAALAAAASAIALFWSIAETWLE